MKKNILTLFTAFTALVILPIFFLSAAHAGESSDPVNMLKSVADRMITSLKANRATLQTNPAVVYSLAGKIIVPYADLNEMSKRVLPPSVWNNASDTQRAQFEKQFTTTLIRTYASALARYKDQTINFFPVRGGIAGKNQVTVNSIIHSADGADVSVAYNLILRGGQWRVFDMTVEGISMLQSFRSQFQGQTSMTALIDTLRQHNAMLEHKDGNA